MTSSLQLKLLPSKLSSLSSKNTTGAQEKQRTEQSNHRLKTTIKVPGSKPRIISSVYGKIKTIILFFPTNGAYSIYPYFEFVKELIVQMGGGGRQFLLIAESNTLSEDQSKALYILANQKGNYFCQVPIIYDSSDLAPWAQDCFLPITYNVAGKDQTYLVEPCNESSNKNVARELVHSLEEIGLANLNIQHSDSLVPFVGGNVLIGKNFTLIGLNRTNKETIKEHGENWLGKNIILLESKSTDLHLFWPECRSTSDGYCNKYEASAERQAVFHLDLFITLAGKNKEGQEILVIGEPVIGFSITDDTPFDIKELIKDVITQTTRAIEETIFHLKRELRNLSIPFKIIRNHLPLTYYDERIDHQKTRYWCWASYNNCLVEHYYDNSGLDPRVVKNVIMPSYGINSDYSSKKCAETRELYGSWTDLHIYDLQNQWLWEDLGYEVTLMRQDYNPFIRRQGSLNCLTNCIERE
ncbi:MAG: hypothetical protein COB67_14035 [SAR324 cluster bacterium]|uniref:Uncharacterized protein n=1 Tax=SAR324 cluster bacterium TaxID=2024889 RepID=A0A2A4SKH1_9DELT|nr:MAG: hypothetical protein COB67_14035 [SAR324 cluster bacterium]